MAQELGREPVLARWLLRLAMLAGGLLVWWAHVTEIEQLTRASAQVIAKARTQVVQAPEGGVIEKIFVREGDRVTKGQRVALLQRQRVQAAVNDTQAKVAALRITLTRLTAEALDRPLRFPAELQGYAEYIQNQTELHAQRQRAIQQDLSSLSASLRLAQEEVDLNEPLFKSGDVSKSDLLRLQRQVADLQAQITNRRNRYFQDVQTEMTKVQEELNTQRESLSDRRQLLDHTSLLAPASGVVKNIRLHTEGGVIRAGEELMQVLPTETTLVVEAKLKPSEVSFVAVGMPVTIKLDAYDHSIHGSLRGKVSYLSADALTEDTRQGEQVFFRLQAEITGREFKGPQADRIEVRPGLTGMVEVQTGRRSVLSYLTKPVSKAMSEAMSER